MVKEGDEARTRTGMYGKTKLIMALRMPGAIALMVTDWPVTLIDSAA
jgi:hypothetical protein